MRLTAEEQAILDGQRGETLAKVMKSLVMYGDTFGAKKMVPATGQAHLVTSFGLSVTTALFDVMDELIAAGLHAEQPFTMDPGRWISKTSPAIFCSGSCSALCTASRRTTRGSCAGWD